MGTVVAMEHLTLDGVMQAPGHPEEDPRDGFAHGGWGTRHQDPALQAAMGVHMAGGWSLLLGRTTYQRFADYWPKQKGNPFSESLSQVQKYVASTTLTEPLPWQHSTLLHGDVPAAVSHLRRELDHNLLIFGSGVLVRSLLEHQLLDQLLLLVHPLALGSGRRLFTTSAAPARFELVDSTTSRTGVVISTYRAKDGH